MSGPEAGRLSQEAPFDCACGKSVIETRNTSIISGVTCKLQSPPVNPSGQLQTPLAQTPPLRHAIPAQGSGGVSQLGPE